MHLRERAIRCRHAAESHLFGMSMRTDETVILDDASSQNPFSADPYIVQRRARSILCSAIDQPGKASSAFSTLKTI